MEDSIRKVEEFITTENCFAVMGQLRRFGVLSKDDVRRAMGMNRQDWISFMKEKAGIARPDITAEGERNVE
jgi:hypothetical protein